MACSIDWTAVGTLALAATTFWLAWLSRDILTVNREELRELQRREKADRDNHKQAALGLLAAFQEDLKRMPPAQHWERMKIAATWEPDDFGVLLNSAHESHHLPVVTVHKVVANLRWLRSAAITNRTSGNPNVFYDAEEWATRYDSSIKMLEALMTEHL